MANEDMVVLADVSKIFRTAGEDLLAVDGVSLSVPDGGSLGIIGESGSGKSTLGRIAVGLLAATQGDVSVAGQDLNELDRRSRHKLRTSVGIVFQEPFASLDPRRSVLASVMEPLEVKMPGRRADRERRQLAQEALTRVGLGAEYADRMPGMLSGGQQQRVGIARAVVTKPAVILLDEPTSALDRSIRAEVLGLLRDLRDSDGLTYLVITHDVETVDALAEDIVVMYQGRVVEQGRADQVLHRPSHPYTRALLGARLPMDPREELPPLADVPEHGSADESDCGFYMRCPLADDACRNGPIPMNTVEGGRVRCVKVPARPAAASRNNTK